MPKRVSSASIRSSTLPNMSIPSVLVPKESPKPGREGSYSRRRDKERDRERQRQRQTDRQTDRERERERDTHTHRDTQKQAARRGRRTVA